jgi:hypothetical protein
MPLNPKTGKTDRRTLSESELLEFRVKQAEERQTGIKRGKQRASGSVDTESESSAPAPSPLGQLSALKKLTLDSGGSSAANTPADSPEDAPRLLLPEDEEPAPPSAQKARQAQKHLDGKSSSKCLAASLTQLLARFVVEPLAPSPLGQLSALKKLTLDSGGSSAANTPADSPEDAPRRPLPEDEEPPPPSAQKARKAPKASKRKSSKCLAASLT